MSDQGEDIRKVLVNMESLVSSYKAIHLALSEPRLITVSLPGTLASAEQPNPSPPPIDSIDAPHNPALTSASSGSQYISNDPHRLIPPYSMSRSVQTVVELWREYTVGLSGLSAMNTMYETGARLFASETDRRFYRRRKLILNLVEQLAKARSVFEVEAAAGLEMWRLHQSGMTLNKLSDRTGKEGLPEVAAALIG